MRASGICSRLNWLGLRRRSAGTRNRKAGTCVMDQGWDRMPSIVIRRFGSTVNILSKIAAESHESVHSQKTGMTRTSRLASYPCPWIVFQKLASQVRHELRTILRRLIPWRIYLDQPNIETRLPEPHFQQEGYKAPLPSPKYPLVQQRIPSLVNPQATKV